MNSIIFKKFALFLFAYILLLNGTAFAKYCSQCGVYNTDSNVYCIKCGTEFKHTGENKVRTGIILLSSLYPGDSAKFTIYYKNSITPFYVLNQKGKYEIGETRIPSLADIDFISIREDEVPSAEKIQELSKTHKLEKIMVFNYNSKKIERVPIFSSQSYVVYFDVTSYNSDGTILQEKRYETSLKSWPNVTVTQIREATNSLWEQMVPNIHILLTK